jgi:replication factor C large subunit
MSQPEIWTEKYRAISLKDFRGMEETISRLKRFIANFPHGKHAALLYGASGTGKTALVYALAHDLQLEVIELNASDLRNREQIENVLNPASSQASLFAKSKIILIDEIDGISAKDRGGIESVIELINTTNYPIFITTNDAWQKKLNPLRQKTELIEVKEIDYKSIEEILKEICRKEKIRIDVDSVKSIAIKCKGDVRAAINDLQSVALLGEIDASCIHEREKEESIFHAMQKVFKAAKVSPELLGAFDSVNMPIDEIFLWIDENLPYEFQGAELAGAYDALSIADVFRGRIIRQQHWRFLVYENALITAGISASKKQTKIGFTQYKKPGRILKMWLAKQRNAMKKTIAEKIATATHASSKRVLKDFYFYRTMLKKDSKIMENLRLSEQEKNFVIEK